MTRRMELHNMLKELLGSGNVYYQPPENFKMNYPAIVYSRENIENNFADDTVYMQSHLYQITVIDQDPDSEIVEKVSRLPACRFNRHFTLEKHNHDVFTLHY